jgi:hypothetical protein
MVAFFVQGRGVNNFQLLISNKLPNIIVAGRGQRPRPATDFIDLMDF